MAYQDYRYIVIFVDTYSKYVVAQPLKEHSATAMANVMTDHIFTHYGLPLTLHSDNAPKFTSNVWPEFTKFGRDTCLILFSLLAKGQHHMRKKSPHYRQPVKNSHTGRQQKGLDKLYISTIHCWINSTPRGDGISTFELLLRQAH